MIALRHNADLPAERDKLPGSRILDKKFPDRTLGSVGRPMTEIHLPGRTAANVPLLCEVVVRNKEA
jgi:hypothetical protein